MSEYPKALYKGDSKDHDFITVDSTNEEDAQRSNGYVNYAELTDPVAHSEVKEDSPESQNLKQELLDALKTIESKDEEILDLKQTYIAEINELKKENRLLMLGNFGANELQKILDEKQVKYGSRDGKDELVKLVFDSEYPIEVGE